MTRKTYPTQQELIKTIKVVNGAIIRLSNGKRIDRTTGILGYRRVRFSKIDYMAHRIIWIYYYGEIPAHQEIDHIDNVRDNNRIENLRLVTHAQNCQRRGSRSDINIYTGIQKTKNGSYTAKVKKGEKFYICGTFNTPEQAFLAYKIKHVQLFGEFSPYVNEVKVSIAV